MRRFTCSAIVSVVGILTACGSFDAASSSQDGGATGTGGGDGGGGGEGGGPAPAIEDCLDGRDDNDDGKRDCEEPSCAPYVHCVAGPGALDGWNGYVTLSTTGDCPPDIPNGSDVWAATPGGASCAACTCASSMDCTGNVSLAESIFAGCMTIKPFDLTVGTCGTIPAASGGTAEYWQLGGVGKGTCTPSASAPAPASSPKFAKAKLCNGARLGGGCPSGQVCASNAVSSANTGVCVARPLAGGAPVPCPTDFPVAHLVVPVDRDPESSFVDKRACTECTCGQMKGGSCNAVLTLYSDAVCGTAKGTVTGTSCTNVSCGTKGCGSGRIDTSNPTPGTCAAAGGVPSGSVELTGPGQQLCCVQ